MGRVALITGGTRGIGLGIAQCLAREGFDLALCGTRAAAEVAVTVDALRTIGPEVLYVQADVSDAAARQRLVEAVKARYRRLNTLVNNAGVAPSARADILEATEESFERVLAINLRGPYFLAQTCATG